MSVTAYPRNAAAFAALVAESRKYNLGL